MRILIVEDERALCDTLAKSLKQKGKRWLCGIVFWIILMEQRNFQ